MTAHALYAGKRVAVVGLGLSNMAVVRHVIVSGADITVFDEKPPDKMEDRVRELGDRVACRLGPGYLDALVDRGASFDFVFLTPGMRKDFPQIEEARRRGAVIDSEMGLFFRLCPAVITGITGSAGKTTTTTLTGRILGRTGRRVYVGGNIGQPLLDRLGEIGPDDLVVLEMSSFQLQLLDQSPQVAALLNIRPNHLDIHTSYQEYAEAKRNIVRFQKPGDVAILNALEPESAACSAYTPARVYHFSRQGEVERGAFLGEGSRIVLRDGSGMDVMVGDRAGIAIPGEHNVENVLAALCLGMVHGVDPREAWDEVTVFRGVEHRLEFVRDIGGVRFINDSIATTPDRTEAALRSFDQPIVLIAGGYDKKIPFNGVADTIVEKAHTLVLIGTTADKIMDAVTRAASARGTAGPEVVRVGSLGEAVDAARCHAHPGDVVLLSPACASYDMFANYQERGRLFKDLVFQLKP